MAKLKFACCREADEVGHGNTVDGSDEGDRNASSNLVDVGEVLHDLNESKDCADDSDGGRIASGSLKHSRDFFFYLGFVVEFELHDLADLGWLGAVDGEHEGLFEERIQNRREIGVEGDDTTSASLIGEGDQLSDGCFTV